MSLRRRLTVSMAIVLVVALAVANAVTYSSLRSFLYGRLDDQIDGAQLQAYKYLTVIRPELLARHPGRVLSISAEANDLNNRVSPDLYVEVVCAPARWSSPTPPVPTAGPG